LIGPAEDELLTGSERSVGHNGVRPPYGRFGSSNLGQHGRFGDTGDFGKTPIQRAVTPWRTSVLAAHWRWVWSVSTISRTASQRLMGESMKLMIFLC
jgi:hypothetical protein